MATLACRVRHVEVTTVEKLTVTEREKLNGVTGTCRVRHEEMAERTTKAMEIKTGTREIEQEKVDETKDEHTHMELAIDNEGSLGNVS